MKIYFSTQIPTEGFYEKWHKFVLDNPYGNFFQSPAYYKFYKSIPSYQPLIISCNDENNNLCGILTAVIQREKGYLKGKLSSRCIVYGGPLVNENNIDIYDLLLGELVKKIGSLSIYIEFRNLFNLSHCKNVFEKNGFDFKEHFNFVVEIDKPEQNLIKLNENRRRQIKKSLKAGAEIVEAKDLEEIKTLYLLLEDLYKEKIKKPLPEFLFFEHFFHLSQLGKYFLIKYEGKIIGGILSPIFKETIYEWYVCGLDNAYKDISPSVLATWAPIEYASKNGLKYFDFLGAGAADRDYGVREFKSKFGGVMVNYGRFIRINNKMLYNIGKLGLKFYSHIK